MIRPPSPGVVLWIIAPLLFAYGLSSLLAPKVMAKHFLQVTFLSPSGRADYLAMYAGVPMGAAVYLAYCAIQSWHRAGLLLAALLLAGFTVLRVYGMFTATGPIRVIGYLALAVEFVGAVVAAWTLWAMG